MDIDLSTRTLAAADGTPLAVHEYGSGRPVLLLHGYFSNAWTNWVRYGHAATLAARGLHVLMPDLRAHGDSGKPHERDAYPPDVLKDDGLAVIDQLGLDDYDLAGYSLGARTAVRMAIHGARPRRLVLAGMGLEGLLDTGGRGEFFREVLTQPGTFARGSPQWLAEAFMKTTGADPVALLRVLDTFVDSTREELATIAMPTLVVAGTEDHDNGSAEAIATLLPNAIFEQIPGNHMSAVARPELGAAIARYLAAD
jgi:pimeloyl-ACP methyl ester carboxylesterase